MTPSPSLFSPSSGRVLAFTRSWSLETLDATAVQALRERIRSLGADLLVITDRGAWAFDGTSESGEYLDRIPGDVVTAATLFAARGGAEAVFVVDGAHVIRVGHHAASLVEALDAAAELLVTRRLVAANPPTPFASLHRWSAEVLP